MIELTLEFIAVLIFTVLISVVGSLCVYFLKPHNTHKKLDKYRIVKRTVLGVGAGIIYFSLMADYTVFVLIYILGAFAAGWFAEDVIYTAIKKMEKYRENIIKKENNERVKKVERNSDIDDILNELNSDD